MNGKGCNWMKVRLISSLILVSVGMVPGRLIQPVAAKEIMIGVKVRHSTNLDDPINVSTLDPAVEVELLERTIQIRIYTSLPTAPLDYKQLESDPGKYLLTSGLGSVVIWQGEYVIVTHNHWGNELDQAEYVQFLDWKGRLLRTLGRNKIMNLILYSDPGTLVLYDPTATWVSKGHLGDDRSVAAGDIVTIAHMDLINPGQVELIQAIVMGQHQENGQSVIGVQVMDDEMIVSGDSGGGIWLHGELIGNTWAVENTRDQAGSSNSGLIAQLPTISIEVQEEDDDSTIEPIFISSDPQMW